MSSIEQALEAASRLHQSGRFDEAEDACRQVLASWPRHPATLHLLGLVRFAKGQPSDAVSLVESAVAAEPAVPGYLISLSGLYRAVDQVDAALDTARHAVAIAPRNARAHCALGLAYMERHALAGAKHHLGTAVSLEPEHAATHLELAHALLMSGELRAGWREYEWRFRLPEAANTIPKFRIPLWNGMRMPGGRILLIGDQGYGDSIQFARYIPAVADLCGEVVLGCSRELSPLLSRIRGVGRCFDRWQDIPAAHFYCPLSSLPRLLGTDIASIPGEAPYLKPEPAAVERWSRRLGEALPGGALRVGIAWCGRPTHPNDRRRSMRLEQLAPVFGVDGTIFVSLQKAFPAADAPMSRTSSGLHDFSSELGDFDETAALIQNLDLVISVDTSVVHLGAALGKPVWVLLPWVPDWRWMLDREDSPWYPTVQLFRQGPERSWGVVVQRVSRALSALQQERFRRATPVTAPGRPGPAFRA